MQSIFRAVVAASALTVSTLVAAIPVTLNPDPLVQGLYSASFEITHTRPDAYADVFEFQSPVDGLLSATFLSPIFTGNVGIGFFAYQLGGIPAVNLPRTETDVNIG